MTGTQHSPPAYNPLFERLVDDEDEITGYVAYALYKQKKRDWIKDFKGRQGRSPTAQELDEYTQGEALPRNITSLKREARSILDAYATAITEDQYDKLKQQAFEETLISQVRETLGRIERMNSFWNQIKAAAVSTVLTTLVLIILSVGIWLFGVDAVDGAQKLRQVLPPETSQPHDREMPVRGDTPVESR
jgi:hypothetical protein